MKQLLLLLAVTLTLFALASGGNAVLELALAVVFVWTVLRTAGLFRRGRKAAR